MVNTKKFSEFDEADINDSSTETVGLSSGINTRESKFYTWTTVTRPATPFNGLLGLNTTIQQYEYWDSLSADWVQLSSDSDGNILPGLTNDLAYYASDGQTLSPIASGVDTVLITTGLSVPVMASSLPAAVQLNIIRTGTVTVGTWNATPIGAVYGGTGLSSYVLGDTIYASAANTLASLAGNITTAKQYLSQTGTGAVSAAPAWSTISGGDITGAALTRVDDTNVTLTLGGTPATALLRATSLTLGWTGQLSLTRGGTNASLTASDGGIVYSTATAMAILSGTPTARQMLQSGASTAPAWSTTTWPATSTINRILYSSANNVINEIATANSATLVTSSTGVPAWTASFTDGQILIGSTGATPVPALPIAGANISITPGAGSLTIAATGAGALARVNVTGATQTITADTEYTSNNTGGAVAYTMPATAAVGSVITIIGQCSGGWSIIQLASQTIHVSPSSTTIGVGGSLASTGRYDSITLRCTVANLEWTLLSQQSAGLTIV